MDEHEWLTATQTYPLLTYLRGRATERKLRLFGAACCRRVWHLLTDERSRQSVVVAERYADGAVTNAQRGTTWRHARAVRRELSELTRRDTVARSIRYWPADAAAGVSALRLDRVILGLGLPDAVGYHAALNESVNGTVSHYTVQWWFDAEFRAQVALAHDIFGNPFRPVTLDASWVTPTVASVAQAIYNERAFDRLGILADSLEDSGCNDAGILAHLRSPGPHVLGCWPVDLILGKF